MRPEIAASILSCDPADFLTPVGAFVAAGVDRIHLDVMDGQFVPPITFGADLAASLVRAAQVPVEAHLMTLTPERHLEDFAKAGVDRFIFHVEATAHAHRLAQQARALGVEAGAAINPGTPWHALEPLLPDLDLALVMTVNPGWGGQKLVRATLPKIAALRRQAPHLRIEVDGGVDAETAADLRAAGADTFVVGSYLLRAPSPQVAVEALRAAWA